LNKIDEIYQNLETICGKRQRNELLPSQEIAFFQDWAITDYLFSPYNLGTIEIEGITFTLDSNSLPWLPYKIPAEIKLCYLQPAQGKKDTSFFFSPKHMKEIPSAEKEMGHVLASIGTVFVYLPPDLTEFQLRAIAIEETFLSYAAPYIIQKAWGKGMCNMPKIDNRRKPELNTYSEQWLKLYHICIQCRDGLSDSELRDIPRAWDLLRLLVHEHRQNTLASCESSENNRSASKSEIVAELRAIADVLSDGNIPFDPQVQPWKYKLMEICLNLADRAEVFRKNLWVPYLASIRNWAAMMDSSSNIVAIGISADGKIMRQRRGTGKTSS
jgi:hypothetical protein